MKIRKDRKTQLLSLAGNSLQYSGLNRNYLYQGMSFDSRDEVRLAMILDEMEEIYDVHVPFENYRDDDRLFTFVPDFVTKRPIKLVGCSHSITILELHGGNYLTHTDLRKMQSVRNLTGKRGHIFDRSHIDMLATEGPVWYPEDFEDFRAPSRDENVDKEMTEILMDVFRNEGKEFYLDPNIRGCIEPTTGKSFTAYGQFFFPEPQKLLGIEEPIQFLRVVKKLTKSTIIALEALRARNINAYAITQSLGLMYHREGTRKKRPQSPDGWSHHYLKNGVKEERNPKKNSIFVNKPNGGNGTQRKGRE